MVARSLGRAQKKRRKKRNQIIFLCLKKSAFMLDCKYPPGIFVSPEQLGNESSFAERASEGNLQGSEFSLLVLPGFRQNWEFLLQKLKSAQGFEPTPCPSLGPCCRGRITRSLPLKTEKHTQRLIHPLPLDKVDKGKFKTSAHFRRCHFSRFAYLPTAIAAYNKLKAARTKLSVVNPIKAGTS